jgi:inosine-uridine nucleoside N-ribohydrolase
VLLPIGKLTNIALALEKDPSIASEVRIVWLGSNYPAPGEYNQENDPASLRYVLSVDVPFEMVTVRYGEPSGTDAIRVTQAEVTARMPGLGPTAAAPVTGRHGGTFRTFGDYAVNLFEHIDYNGDPPARALYDMAAVAILKQPDWARAREQPAPALVGDAWEERPDNPRRITIWEDFDRDAIMADFYRVLQRPVVAQP